VSVNLKGRFLPSQREGGLNSKPGEQNLNMIRIQLDLPEERVRELDEVMRTAQITTRKDLFNSALTFLAWALSERDKGRVIASLDESTGGYKELVMPFFSFTKKPNSEGNSNNNNGHELSTKALTHSDNQKGGFEKARGKTAGVIEAATLTRGRR
jgi:hypothetical protein